MNIVYQPLKETNREPEYQTSSPLPISSIGTENTKKITGQLPYGSVLLTDTGTSSPLKDKGIRHIAHAAMMPLNSDRSNETKFRAVAALCIQNAVFLANKNGHKRLATCFLGGKIYCSVEEAKPSLAVAIILAGLGQLETCSNLEKIYFVDYDGDYFKNAKKAIELGTVGITGVENLNRAEVVRGDLCKKNGPLVHDATIIVNSENAQMDWGGGISGAIGKALGAEKNSIGAERVRLRNEFNSLIQEDNNRENKKHTFVVQTTGVCPIRDANEHITEDSYYTFKIKDKEKVILVDYYHPAFTNNQPKQSHTPEKKETIIWYKVSFKGDMNKLIRIRKNDFFEIEEITEQNKTPKTCAFCSKTFAAGNGIIYNNKDYCSSECSLKQQEKDSPSKPNKNDSLDQVRNQAISDINQALDLEPQLTNSDLLSDYQNWEKVINQTNSESEINQFKEQVLSDIKNKRKIKRESAVRDQKINQAHTEEEKINLLKEMGSSLGELTPEQETKLERIKDDLSTNPPQLRDAVQKEIISHLTASGVRAEDLNSATKNQWESLKNEVDSIKIRTIEKQLIQAIGEKGAELKLTSLIQQVDAVLKDKQKTKIQEVKDKLLELISSPNSFLQTKKTQFQALLQKLNQGVQNQNNTPSVSNRPEFPWKVAIPVLLFAVGGITVLAILLRKNKRKSH